MDGIIYLTLEQAEVIHRKTITYSGGGTYEPLDTGKLDSVLPVSYTHLIEVHIGRIRERFKENSDFEIVTMRGIGYKVVKKS